MKIRYFLFIPLVLMLSGSVWAQSLYVYSDLQIDDASGNVTMMASASADYSTAYYYDLGISAYLVIQPDGGGYYYSCDRWGSTTTSSYIEVNCSYNMGSQTGQVDLIADSWLDATYYYYQLVYYCGAECYDYGDYYGYSLLSTGGTYAGNPTFYPPGYLVPVSSQTTLNATLIKQKRRGGCLYPTNESTIPWSWNAYHPYAAHFLQNYQTLGSFDGRTVTESFSGSAADHCWRPENGGSPIQNPDAVSIGTWVVGNIMALDANLQPGYLFGYNNGWGFDHIGFWGSAGSTRLYNYMMNMRPTSSACSIDFTQNMFMYCSTTTGTGEYYKTGIPLSIIIYATPSTGQLTSSRAQQQQVKSYP